MKSKWVLSVLLIMMFAGGFYYFGYFPAEFNSESNSIGSVINLSEPEDSYYLPLDPPFIVNFTHQDTLRYLQISLEVMYHDENILNRVDEHMPAIRNAMILLLSDQEFETLSTLSGKQHLRHEMKLAINDLIGNTAGMNMDSHESGEIYFTNFVMQ